MFCGFYLENSLPCGIELAGHGADACARINSCHYSLLLFDLLLDAGLFKSLLGIGPCMGPRMCVSVCSRGCENQLAFSKAGVHMLLATTHYIIPTDGTHCLPFNWFILRNADGHTHTTPAG